MQNPGLVGRDLDVAHQRRVAPDAERVVREAGGADDLAVVRAPAQAGDLRARVDAVDARARCRVPEVDVAVVGAAPRREQVVLPRAPAERLHGRLVVGLGELGRAEAARVPDGDDVVVAARGQLRAVRPPLEPAHLGRVRDQLGHLVLRDAHVVVEDQAAACARR